MGGRAGEGAWNEEMGEVHGEAVEEGSSVPLIVPLPLPHPSEGEVRTVFAGGQSSAVLQGRARRASTPRPATLSLGEVSRLVREEDWGSLASRVEVVFSSTALFNASFAARGALQAETLEEVYKYILSTYRAAPHVVAALRASSPRLLAQLAKAIGDEEVALLLASNENSFPPPMTR